MTSPTTSPHLPLAHDSRTTRFLIANLHCPTCVATVESTLAALHPKPLSVSTSILSHSVIVRHDAALKASTIRKALEDAAFEVHSVARSRDATSDTDSEEGRPSLSGEEGEGAGTLSRWWWLRRHTTGREAERRRRRHISQCSQCQAESAEQMEKAKPGTASLPGSSLPLRGDLEKGHVQEEALGSHDTASKTTQESHTADVPLEGVVVDSAATSTRPTFRASLAIGGMTCSSCVGSISSALEQRAWVRSVDVNLLTNSATVLFEDKEHLSDLVQAIEDLGYEAHVEHVDDITGPEEQRPSPASDIWRASFSIGGMTCSSCVGNVTVAVQQLSWVESVEVNLITNSAVVVFRGEENLQAIQEAVENVGYEVTLDDKTNVGARAAPDVRRKVAIRVAGMHCVHCPQRVSDALTKNFGDGVHVEKLPTQSDPILRVTYTPKIPDLTIRHIIASVASADAAFEPAIYHPPSLEERSQHMLAREQRRILLRLAFAVTAAIPTFILGIVLMTLVDSKNASRRYVSEPAWAGNVSRGQWALFIIATPVYFFAADVFHKRMIKELRAQWGPRSTTPILRRFYRFGSMNMLISIGTTIAYFSSIAELAIAATQPPDMASTNMGSSYFDSVVFLTMFLLIGRFLEAYSKARTGDAVTLLGKLRPAEAMLVDPAHETQPGEIPNQPGDPAMHKIPVELLEIGDTVKVLQGGAPPSDGIVVGGDNTQFDESSLTGESRPVTKHLGDEVYAGTVNKASPVSIRITNVAGASMLDQIIKVVREGQARRAPIERVADLITSHFVPLVVLLGVSTWIIWLALGLSGTLPESYRDTNVGGWPFWSLQFSIAVFVIACPCGIGLAAPTALFVGGGLAAQHGILVRGGGEAFQEASRLDCIVFDKTGTLTEGGEPSVTDYECLPGFGGYEHRILEMATGLEENSSHPVAKALVAFCDSKIQERINVTQVSEIPGKGMRGLSSLSSSDDQEVEIILGNEALMHDYGVQINDDINTTLDTWKSQGKSVALFAMKTTLGALTEADNGAALTEPEWRLANAFAVSDKLRPDAAGVIAALKSRGVDVWMISGDNPATAQAIAKMVGISDDNVIAGVLPEQKATKIQYLQKTLERKSKHGSRNRATVAMVGDGINDAPALTMADVGIAVGSGSDVAISSAEFVLMSSSLTSLLVLIDLSRTVFRRVWFNFGWALVYNLLALPIAAGVLYPVNTNGGHIRLDPVWASLAMAASSVSVVCSSLLLRSRLPGVGFRSATVSR